MSLTTDDLLVLPTDGSMPVTRTSAYLSQRLAYPQGHSTTSRSLKTQDLLVSTGPSRRRRGQGEDLGGEGGLLGPYPNRQPKTRCRMQREPPNDSSHHYPRWLTSLKSDMDFSGVTSIPDQMFPTWLRDCEGTSSGHALGKPGRSRTYPPSPKAPSRLGQLEELEGRAGSLLRGERSVSEAPGERANTLTEEAGQPDLRELRLESAEQLASAGEREREAQYDPPFRG